VLVCGFGKFMVYVLNPGFGTENRKLTKFVVFKFLRIFYCMDITMLSSNDKAPTYLIN